MTSTSSLSGVCTAARDLRSLFARYLFQPSMPTGAAQHADGLRALLRVPQTSWEREPIGVNYGERGRSRTDSGEARAHY